MANGWSRTRTRVVSALVLLSGFCLGMLAVRTAFVVRPGHLFLVWNLFLAWIPLVAALAIYDRARDGRGGPAQVALSVAWLAFLPNAPYIVTDLIHLRHTAGPLWFDSLLFLSFAWAGLMLGLVSLSLVHRTAAAAWGSFAGWALVFGAILLSGIGVYIGRVLRWNSWDLVANPGALLADVVAFASAPSTTPVLFAAVFAAFLAVAYLTLDAVAGLRERLSD